MASSPGEITELLARYRDGDRAVLDRLMPLVYDELRRLAARQLRKERAGHTLQPTALVHEAYFRLVDQRDHTWQNRAHFYGVAAHLMRCILVDYARARHREKRGGGQLTLAIDEALFVPQRRDVDLIALDEALKVLSTMDSQQEQVVELRFFGGLTVGETAEVLGVSAPTVKRHWASARAWLKREIRQGGAYDA